MIVLKPLHVVTLASAVALAGGLVAGSLLGHGRTEASAAMPADTQSIPCSSRYQMKAAGRDVDLGNLGDHARLIHGSDASSDDASIVVNLPRGSINPSSTGAPAGGLNRRWRKLFPQDARSACLSYDVRFADDFKFARGGKLPGLFGGDGPAGGRRADGSNGFSVRPMWRAGGAGEAYLYVPGHPDRRGLSVGRGNWHFTPGAWTRIEMELTLNSPGRTDGQLVIWIGGREVIRIVDMIVRTSGRVALEGTMMDVFYGGRDPSWAAPQDTTLTLTVPSVGWR